MSEIPTTIEVTAEHIANAIPCDPFECAVALAIKAVFDGYVAVLTNYVELGENHFYYGLPDEARAFIRKLDAGESVEPFTFTLGPKLPDDYDVDGF